MRTVYIITYDVSDDRRWRKVFKLMRGHGDHLQYSVFRCELSDRERIGLIERLTRVIKHDSDQVLFFPLGPAGGADEERIQAIGVPYRPPRRGAIVV
jgi:CRISPR-associated protein Cas2